MDIKGQSLNSPIFPTSEVEVLSVVIGAEVNMFHNVSFGPVRMLTWPVLRGLQHSHTSVGKMGIEDGIQRSFLCTARIT